MKNVKKINFSSLSVINEKAREAYIKYKKAKIPSLSAIREKASQYSKTSLFIVVISVLIFLFMLQQVPHLQVAEYGINNTTTEADLENQYRATLAQIIGGFVLLIGLLFTWKNIRIAQENTRIAQESQITERFTRAVDQLGTPPDSSGKIALESRLGGIYALERIANESEKDYWPIMEILTAYIRKNSPSENENIKVENVKNQNKISLDIQAILIVIKRRRLFNSGRTNGLDLQGTYLQEANLEETNLEEANLEGADLRGANLQKADLREAKLAGANLEGANLEEANLEGAKLKGFKFLEAASLQKAYLCGANLQKANLQKANLKGAYFKKSASLQKAANLERANLEGAKLNGANLEEANLTDAKLKEANFEGANLEGANLNGANLNGANLERTNLQKTQNLSLDQLSKVKTLYNAKLDEELFIPLKEKFSALFEKPPKDK